MVEISDRTAIDATESTDPMRYTNHSCQPNARLQIRDGRIEFYALRAITPGEEITVNYGETHHEGRPQREHALGRDREHGGGEGRTRDGEPSESSLRARDSTRRHRRQRRGEDRREEYSELGHWGSCGLAAGSPYGSEDSCGDRLGKARTPISGHGRTSINRMIAGPTTTIIRTGRMQNTVGKIIFIGTLAAFSSTA